MFSNPLQAVLAADMITHCIGNPQRENKRSQIFLLLIVEAIKITFTKNIKLRGIVKASYPLQKLR